MSASRRAIAPELARILVASALAAGLAAGIFVLVSGELAVRTDIVGYPTYANFDVDRYLWAYALTVAFFPLATLALYVVLTRLVAGSVSRVRSVPRPLERVEPVPGVSGWRAWPVALGRTFFVGCVLGLEVAIVLSPAEPLDVVAILAAGYVVLVAASASALSLLTHTDTLAFTRIVNVLGAALSVAGLHFVSESTQVTVAATGAVYEYPWLPALIAFGGSGLVLVWLGTRFVRAGAGRERALVERAAVLLVVGPVAVFLIAASLPATVEPLRLFEEGQVLAGAELSRDGAFPWRDFLMAHGLLHDVFGGLVGSAVFEESRWGVLAGNTMLLEPLYWLALYYLCVYLFGSNWLFLLATQVLVLAGDVLVVHVRFALLPLALLLLAALLRRARFRYAAGFAAVLFVQVVVTPEALAAAVAYLGALFGFELYYYERGSGIAAGFRRTLACASSGAVLIVLWLVFLLANGALDDWLYSFTTLASGHRLKGGIPSEVPITDPEVVLPVALVIGAFAFFVVRSRTGRPLALQDWIAVATAGLTALYYPKFLARADELHLDQAFSVAIPLLFYAVYRVVSWLEPALAQGAHARGMRWMPTRHTVTLPVLAALVASAPTSLLDSARAAPIHFAVVAPNEPELDRVGYDDPDRSDSEMIRGVSRAVDSLLGPGGTVFDFSNAPGLFHYLLDLPVGTRYYHVSLAISRETQEDLERFLEDRRPDLVVLTSDGTGLSAPSWDGIANQVRHYEISQYLLDEYVPVRSSHGFVFMVRRQPGARADPRLYFAVDSCDWGYVPNFFAPAPSAYAEPLSLPLRALEPGRSWTVTLPVDDSARGYRWLEVRTGYPIRKGRFTLSDRQPAAGSSRTIAFSALDRGVTSIRVRVGSCSQWRGYRPGTLFLTSSVPQDIREVRLLR